jgi:hypothetical protein
MDINSELASAIALHDAGFAAITTAHRQDPSLVLRCT